MTGGKRKTREGHGGTASDEPTRDLELEGGESHIGGAVSDDVSPAAMDDLSAYLVACHWDWSRSSKPFCVFKMLEDPSSPSAATRKRLKPLRRLKADAGGKVFTSVSSRHRKWIVGVGGAHGDTVIFDTDKEVAIRGPNLNSAKWCPVLTAVGDKVYAMSKTPSWVSEPDFPPWFEVLDLSQAQVVTGARRSHLEGCSWTALPHPPCVPWELSPTDYTMLPIVFLMSYAVLDPYILVSFNKPWGTYAFDTNSCEWHKVDDNRLPFFGRATPLGGSIFLGLSRKDGPISAYRIRVSTSDKEDNALKLSITVLPVKYMEHEVDSGPCFSSLDSERFCSLSLSLDSQSLTYNPEDDEWFPRKVHVNLTTYQIENHSLLDNPEELQLAVKPEIAVSSQQKHALQIASTDHGFSPFAFSLLTI